VVDHRRAVDLPAAEQVDGNQGFLGPGMNAQVRLGQDQDESDRAVREDDVRDIEHVTRACLDGGHGHRGQRGQVVDWRVRRAGGVERE
jgi:hypothetical protein